MELPNGSGSVELNPIDPGGRSQSDPTALDHQLKLPNSGTTDVEAGPTQSKKDGRCHEDEPEVHESSREIGRS